MAAPLTALKNYTYDGSFEGLLSCIFLIYQNRIPPADIVVNELMQFNLLDGNFQVTTDMDHAERVIKAINSYTNDEGGQLLYHLFLSELARIEMIIYELVKILMAVRDMSVLNNFANPIVLKSAQINRMISREVHRMHAFVRFQKTRTGIFYAVIEPDFNVLPLLGEHFARRYADQPWLILDKKRSYGLFYDLNECRFVAAGELDVNSPGLENLAMDEQEMLFQKLWGVYFHSVNIKERNNPRLHLRHMPKRYWKYLIEKHPGT